MVESDVRDAVLAHPWRDPMTVELRDGTKRSGRLKHRDKRGFSLSDDIWTIHYANVAGVRRAENRTEREETRCSTTSASRPSR